MCVVRSCSVQSAIICGLAFGLPAFGFFGAEIRIHDKCLESGVNSINLMAWRNGSEATLPDYPNRPFSGLVHCPFSCSSYLLHRFFSYVFTCLVANFCLLFILIRSSHAFILTRGCSVSASACRQALPRTNSPHNKGLWAASRKQTSRDCTRHLPWLLWASLAAVAGTWLPLSSLSSVFSCCCQAHESRPAGCYGLCSSRWQAVLAAPLASTSSATSTP